MVECLVERALCTENTEVNLSAFVYRLFHEDFLITHRDLRHEKNLHEKKIFVKRNLHETVCNLCFSHSTLILSMKMTV